MLRAVGPSVRQCNMQGGTHAVLPVPFPLAELKEDSKWGLRQERNPVKSF